MSLLRLSKYDPQRRDEAGRYLANEWTSAHDIGSSFEAGPLTLESYLAVEAAYVAACEAFYADARAPRLFARGVEAGGPPPALVPLSDTLTVEEGQPIDGQILQTIVRACLREMLWCRLESDSCTISFGYDYYVYWTGAVPSVATLDVVKRGKLFLERVPGE